MSSTRAAKTRSGCERDDRMITVPETVSAGKAWYVIRIAYGGHWLNFLGWPITVESLAVP